LLVIAATWSVGLLVAAAVVPAYSSMTVASSGSFPGTTATSTVRTTATLVQENGTRVLALVALPLLAVIVVTLSLWRRRRRARHGAGMLAWTVLAVVGGLTLVSMLTIGPFILPVALLLTVACARA
jgi:hypothetical protein